MDYTRFQSMFLRKVRSILELYNRQYRKSSNLKFHILLDHLMQVRIHLQEYIQKVPLGLEPQVTEPLEKVQLEKVQLVKEPLVTVLLEQVQGLEQLGLVPQDLEQQVLEQVKVPQDLAQQAQVLVKAQQVKVQLDLGLLAQAQEQE